MKSNNKRLMFTKMPVNLFVFILFSFMSSMAIAESIRIVDQFDVPIENVVVSFKVSDSVNNDKHDVAIMDQVDKQFAPQVLVVQKNQTVSFPNSDDIRHHLYSFSKPKQFEFKMFKGGESKSLTFDQTGIVVLGCNIHDQMIGYIYVADNESTVVTNNQGIAQVPRAGLAVKLWHPRLSANKIDRKDLQLGSSNTEHPLTVTLTLLADVKTSTKSKFGSKQFKRGNQ